MKQARVGFIMFTEIGLKTQYLNWRNALSPEMGLQPEWIVIEWWKEGGRLERMGFLPGGVKARVRAWLQLREGLKRGPFDALFIAGKKINADQGTLERQPYFLTTDVTPQQMYAFGSLYGKTPSRFAFVERRKHGQQRQQYRNAAALFPWSRWAAESLVNDYGVDPARIHVIPPGIDLSRWQFPARTHDGQTNILFVGGEFYRKGGDLLLDWAKRTKLRDWTLHLVTREKVTPPDPRVQVYNGLWPNAPELMRLYREAHLFALPTRGDCYSLAAMEAMAAGLPIILSRTGGTGDILRDGETGYLIEPGDGAAMAERLDYLIARPERREAMGTAARQDAEARYDACANIRRTVQLMLSCLR